MSAAAGTTLQATLRARKEEHQRLAASDAVQTRTGPGWRDVHLVHEALPEVDLAAVSLATELLGHRLAAPLLIAGMTGGHDGATAVNATLARAAERHGLAIGLGSQRAALIDPTLEPTYAVVREHAPSAFVIGNVGAAQLIGQEGKGPLTFAQLRRTVEMIDADALAIHLNVLEESVQPEGDRRARGVADAIAELVGSLGVPVIVKETGAGMARATAERLAALGVAALDVGGLGGTSFALVERLRAQLQHERRGIDLTVDLASDLPQVRADGVQIQQVLVNLVQNAFDAVGAQERFPRQVRVATRREDSGEVAFRVSDNGEGIPPSALESIFDPYFSTRADGLGMGLAIAKRIVGEHGGRIDVESEPGRHTAIQFTLPAAGDGERTDGLHR